MTVSEGPREPPPDPSELELLLRGHANIAPLVLVLESHLALMSTGDELDACLMLDAVGYLVDHVGRFHRTDGEELRRRLEQAGWDELVDRRELVRLGFAYCTEVRRSMLLEETTLSGASSALEHPALHPSRSAGEEQCRAQFEELTQRIGCDCAYGRAG